MSNDMELIQSVPVQATIKDTPQLSFNSIFVGTAIILSNQYVWRIHSIYVSSTAATTLTMSMSGMHKTFNLPAGFSPILFAEPWYVAQQELRLSVSVGEMLVVAARL